MSEIVLEPMFIAFIAEKFPEMKVMLAPDEYVLGHDRICGISCNMLPLQGLRGFRGVVDVDLFDVDRSRLIASCWQVLRALHDGFDNGVFPQLSSLEVTQLPHLVSNPTSAQSLKVATFTVNVSGHVPSPRL